MGKTKLTSPAQKLGRLPRWLKWMLGFGLTGIVLLAGGSAYGAHLENNDQFCASCHTRPETIFVARAQHSAVDLASAHSAKGVNCIACHSGEGVAGRLEALKLGAHDLVAYASRNYPQPAVTTHPIGDVNCLKCHQKILQNRSFDNHFHVLLPRWQEVDPENAATCVQCHSGHADNGEPRLAWLNRQQTVAQCNACHRIAG